jgi:hypothetical protein
MSDLEILCPEKICFTTFNTCQSSSRAIVAWKRGSIRHRM